MPLVIRVVKVRDNAIVKRFEIEASAGWDGEGGVLAESIVKLATRLGSRKPTANEARTRTHIYAIVSGVIESIPCFDAFDARRDWFEPLTELGEVKTAFVAWKIVVK
jgi:hypothetical protein